jgi:hypothetical protein
MRRLGKLSPFFLGIWLLGTTLARSFELPNEFAKIHWLIDYRVGFIKRGFIGSVITILSRFGGIAKSENLINVVSFASIAIFYTLAFLVIWRVLKKTNYDSYSYCIAYILLSSPFVVTSGHFFGYFDTIIIIISFVCVWLIIHRKILLCSLLAMVALLIHENYLVIGFPLMIFAIYTTQSTADLPSKKEIFYPIIAVMATFLILFIAENLFTDKDQLRINLELQFNNAGFIDRDWSRVTAIWITTSMSDYLRNEVYGFYGRIFNFPITLMILPSVLAILLFTYEKFKPAPRSNVMLYALCTTVAPLLLHFIAWDTQRISAYTIVTAFGCLWICAETLPALRQADRPAPNAQLMIGIALAANCFLRLPLLRNKVDGLSVGVRIGLYAPVFLTLLFYYLRWWVGQPGVRLQVKRRSPRFLNPGLRQPDKRV